MTNDSDAVFLGYSRTQEVIEDGFIFIDSDKRKKTLDVLITSFDIINPIKGVNKTSVDLCGIINPLKFANLDNNKFYIIFAKKLGRYYVLTHGSMSQIEIENNKVKKHFFMILI